jgi:hypothetical protein
MVVVVKINKNEFLDLYRSKCWDSLMTEYTPITGLYKVIGVVLDGITYVPSQSIPIFRVG